MRRISVVILGLTDELRRVRALALTHDIDMLLVPPDNVVPADTIRRALAKAG